MPSIASLSKTTVVPTRTLADHRSSPASRAIEFLIGGGARRGALSGRSSGQKPSTAAKGSLFSILPPYYSYLHHTRGERRVARGKRSAGPWKRIKRNTAPWRGARSLARRPPL